MQNTMRRAALEQRSSEAGALIQQLIASGITPGQIAERAQVSERTVYRWWKEGRAPHPLLLDGLRRMATGS